MANLRLSRIILEDRWPGSADPRLGIPTNGWDNTQDNFTTTSANDVPRYPVGTKISAYTDNTNCPGWYTMMMLMHHSYCSAKCVSADFSDGNFWCSHVKEASTAQFADTSKAPYFVVAQCLSGTFTDASKGTPIAVPVAEMTEGDGTTAATNGYGDTYGWFWVGGVCPCADATLLQGTAGSLLGADITVDGALHKGPLFMCSTGSTPWVMSADETNIHDLTTGVTLGDPAGMVFGWACVSAA